MSRSGGLVSVEQLMRPREQFLYALPGWMARRPQLQVTEPVVVADPVAMVNRLVIEQLTPEMCFHNETVDEHVAATGPVNDHVSALREVGGSALSAATCSSDGGEQSNASAFEKLGVVPTAQAPGVAYTFAPRESALASLRRCVVVLATKPLGDSRPVTSLGCADSHEQGV